MARQVLHKFDYKGTERYVLLNDSYTNIDEQTGIEKVTEEGEGGAPSSVTKLVREGSLVKIRCGVTESEDGPIKQRVIYSDIDSAEAALGSVLGKQLPAFGSTVAATIVSARVGARRRLR